MLFVLAGFTITVALNESQLSITVAAPDNFLNDTKGLLGVFNKDPSDDLTPADGSAPLSTNATEKEIFNQFGETCKLSSLNHKLNTRINKISHKQKWVSTLVLNQI